MAADWMLATCLALFGQLPADAGAIEGTVSIASENGAPAAGAEVALRVALDGQFVPLAESTTDGQGRFRFAPLPVGPEYLYLPGANRHGVHYPGARVRLTPGHRTVHVNLKVCDAVAGPNPLIARRHEIVIRPAPGALKVTETIEIDNPTARSFVGRADGDGDEPVTLELRIPSDFERTTFEKEFFGRRFSLVDRKLVTSIPWQPGRRELKFTYVLRNEQAHRAWERPLDLPCSHVRVCVDTDQPDEVACSLASQQGDGTGQVVFESTGRTLPAGHVIRVDLGRLPVPWMAYGRWLAVAALVSLVGGTGVMALMRRRAGRVSSARSAAEEKKGARSRTTSRRAPERGKPQRASRRAA